MKKKIIALILIIIWMITVFYFSSQHSEESSNLSRGVTLKVFKILKVNPKTEEAADKIETIIRKLAHFCMYLIGGILILANISLYNISENKKVLFTQLTGSIYAITDEVHQLYVPGRSGEVRDILIDSLGILAGIAIVLLIKKVIKPKLKEG